MHSGWTEFKSLNQYVFLDTNILDEFESNGLKWQTRTKNQVKVEIQSTICIRVLRRGFIALHTEFHMSLDNDILYSVQGEKKSASFLVSSGNEERKAESHTRKYFEKNYKKLYGISSLFYLNTFDIFTGISTEDKQ